MPPYGFVSWNAGSQVPLAEQERGELSVGSDLNLARHLVHLTPVQKGSSRTDGSNNSTVGENLKGASISLPKSSAMQTASSPQRGPGGLLGPFQHKPHRVRETISADPRAGVTVDKSPCVNQKEGPASSETGHPARFRFE